MTEYSKTLNDLPESKIRAFHHLAKSYTPLYKLSLGDCEIDTPKEIVQCAIEALTNGYTHYEENQGNLELRENLSFYEKKMFQGEYSAEEILITQGATQGISLCLQTLLNPQDEVMVLLPAYPLYEQLIVLNHAKYRAVTLPCTSFEISTALLEENYTSNTKILIINHPHNPTGHVLTEVEMDCIRQFVCQHDLFLVVDECYVLLQYQNSFLSFAIHHELHSRMIICRSFSKAYAMSGWRLGYLLGSKETIAHCTKVQQATLSCVASFIQQAPISALSIPPLTSHYQAKAQLAYSYLSQVFPIHCLEGGLYYFLPISKYSASSEEFCLELLSECGIALIPGTAFGYEGYVRLSLCLDNVLLEEALQKLVLYLKSKEKGNGSP